jgi:hypothetical protein
VLKFAPEPRAKKPPLHWVHGPLVYPSLLRVRVIGLVRSRAWRPAAARPGPVRATNDGHGYKLDDVERKHAGYSRASASATLATRRQPDAAGALHSIAGCTEVARARRDRPGAAAWRAVTLGPTSGPRQACQWPSVASRRPEPGALSLTLEPCRPGPRPPP